MKPLINIPPRTIMEVYKNLPEGTLAELIDNVIYMSPSPTTIHQKTLKAIIHQLDKAVEESGLGTVIFAPFDVYMDEKSNAVQPDILVILKTNRGELNENGHFHGVPDLVVEILSPGNKEYDLIKKKDLYERFGVKEYWIVDPQTKLALGYELNGNHQYIKIYEEIGMIHSVLLKSKMQF